ncbi:MAG: Rpn family recombination-promoting nuclease/putative transposase [Pirellula sp.]|jgi:predicted transposase YdaD|nr:Rpn family recombination-promoting nuclease/putative transposase [Pirellula sp.]
MDQSKLPTPHNNFFQYALSHPAAARNLIELHLPADLVQILDLDSLELQKDSFIDDELRDSYSDMLYSIRLSGRLSGQDGEPIEGQVYLLLEHKSQSDPMTCFQMLRYIVRIWEQRLRKGQSLCPVFPLVIYHGQEAWSAPVGLEELIGGPGVLFEYGVRMAFKILDIGQIPDELLATDPFLQSVLGLLKYSRTRDFEDKLEFILRCLLEIGTVELQTEHLDAVLVYITTVSPSIPMETLAMTIQKIFPTQIEPGSIADEYMKKGRQEGKQEGKQEGLKEGQIQLIQTLQEILGLPLSDASTFQDRSLDQLQAITAELRQQVRERN